MSTEINVWDPLVRMFHWTLVAAFTTAYVVEDHVMVLHELAGYAVLGLVLVRILWGFVGTHYARFAEFVRGPRAVFAYLRSLARRQPENYVGHNPAGGAMIVALLLSLLATTLTGLTAYGIEGSGLLGAVLWPFSVEAEETMEEVHEFFANLTVLLVVVHLAGVAVGSWLHHENLVRAMVTGRKNIH